MHLYQQLQRDTQADRDYLLAAPTIQLSSLAMSLHTKMRSRSM
jgi:hypothetical protein